jgi:hypothetical protein
MKTTKLVFWTIEGSIFPLIVSGILAVSYIYYRKLYSVEFNPQFKTL